MASRQTTINHSFAGGWVSDVGDTTAVGPDQGGNLVFPYLTAATNVFFEPDGGPHKIGGTTKLNSSALASGAEIMGLYDYWVMGAAGTGTQQRIVHLSTVIMADAADGTFANIQTGLTDNAIPCYTSFGGSVIMSSDAGDAVQTYNGTTCAALGGSPPAFSFSAEHKNRVWAAGVTSNQSTLYYSSSNNAAQWNGTGTSGSISVAVNDGDRITGLVSHGDELYIFKGPYFGSIHILTGSSPTGSDAFSLRRLVSGIGCVWQNTIFKYRGDVGFMWSDGSIRSLAYSLNFGALEDAALSRPIHKWIRANMNYTHIRRSWAAVDKERSLALFAIPTTTNFPDTILMMDFSRDQLFWARWTAYNCSCLASVIDPADSNKRKIFAGGADGFVRKTNAADRSIDTSGAYTATATMPFTHYGDGSLTKTIEWVAAKIVPKGVYTLTFGWKRDGNTQQTATATQGTSDTKFIDKFLETETSGEFRQVQYEFSQAGASQDMEVHSFQAAVKAGSISMESTL